MNAIRHRPFSRAWLTGAVIAISSEAGRVGNQKLKWVIHRFQRTHFAFGVWGSSLSSMTARVNRQARGVRRLAPVDVIAFPEDAVTRFFEPKGTIRVHHSDLNWQRFV